MKIYMKRMKTAFTLIVTFSVLVTGCFSTVHRLNNLSVGMTKKEVIKVMGSPDTTRSPGGGVELLCFHLKRARPPLKVALVEEYFVRMVDGKVESFGEKGDFDSTKDSTRNINLNIKKL